MDKYEVVYIRINRKLYPEVCNKIQKLKEGKKLTAAFIKFVKDLPGQMEFPF